MKLSVSILQTVLLSLTVMAVSSCAHYGDKTQSKDAPKNCSLKNKKNCPLKKKQSECKHDGKCTKKNCELKRDAAKK